MDKLLLHGDNIVESRDHLLFLKKKHTGEVIALSGKTLEIDMLIQATQSASLFSENKLIIIENLFSKLSKVNLDKILNFLDKNKFDFEIILWEGKALGKRDTNKIKSFILKQFDIPKLLFKFVESINPLNKQKSLELLYKVRKNASDDFIFLMVVRQIRLLIMAKNLCLDKMPGWMIHKFKSQADCFSQENLVKLYRKLLLIDIGQKTGSYNSIGSELDLLIATL